MATAEPIVDASAVREKMRTEAFRSMQQVIGVTEELFGRIVEIKNDFDPEYSDDQWTVLVVEVDAAVGEERFEKELEWHRRQTKVTSGWDPFRLYIRRTRCDRSTS